MAASKIAWLIRQDFLKVPWPQAIIKLWPPIRSLGLLKNSANYLIAECYKNLLNFT